MEWCQYHLEQSKCNDFKNKITKKINRLETIYQLKPMLGSGWYMLEIMMLLPLLKTKSYVILDYDLKTNITEYISALPFQLTSKRISKRIVYLSSDALLHLGLEIPQEYSELQHFRLIKVNQRFARSRMLTKLKTLHPNYKTNESNHKVSDELSFGNAVELPTLWQDYCTLFEENSQITPYPNWVKEFNTLTDNECTSIREKAEDFICKPLISIVMPVYNPNPTWLASAINSLISQIYENWELCIADDASTDPAIRKMLEAYSLQDQRIKVAFRKQNGHISAASNTALELAKGEWIALLDHDDELSEHALFLVVDTINKHPTCKMIYSDEDKIDELGKRSEPNFKCDWNPDLFYSQNMFSHLGVYHSSLIKMIGGFREGFEGAQDYDLALRCTEHISPDKIHHIPRVLYHWRIHAESTAHTTEAKPYAMLAGERALNEHLQRININAKAELIGFGYRVRYALPESLPLVSLIIPTHNAHKLLKQCVDSILKKTTYSNYEILIVDNNSDDPDSLHYLRKLESEPKIRVIRDSKPFNYSALNNAAVKLANGEIIGLVNNDVEVISPEWLSEMVSHALRPEVAAVGAKLWYGDDTIQHAGIILGIHGIAGHAHRFTSRQDNGYCARASLIQSFSAVTGACLVVRKSIYESLGGLNETELQIACNDVDFCLRVREAGYRNIWTPYAELYHHESSTRGFDDTPEKVARSAKEIAYMQQRWGNLLLKDPAYNPNLSLDSEDFSLAWPPRH